MLDSRRGGAFGGVMYGQTMNVCIKLTVRSSILL